MIKKNIIEMLLRAHPGLKTSLRAAHMRQSPEQFVKKTLLLALYSGFGITALLFFFLSKAGMPMLLVIPAFPLATALSYMFFINTPKGAMRKRQRLIDNEVLFAGRYLLVKLEAGEPLFNSLIDASKSYGVAGQYFKEIVDDISTGTPIEEALENARKYTISEKFKKILWEIITTIKTGVEVTSALRSTLKTITNEQITEIKQYAKKLNALMMFYMVVACVAPSLGMTIFIIFSGFLQLSLTSMHFFAVLFMLSVLQAFFIIMIKATRPMVNI